MIFNLDIRMKIMQKWVPLTVYEKRRDVREGNELPNTYDVEHKYTPTKNHRVFQGKLTTQTNKREINNADSRNQIQLQKQD